MREGVDAFYNFEYEKSLRILSSARTEYPSHPVVHAVWAAAWYQYDQSQFPEKKVYSNFESRLQKVEKYTILLQQNTLTKPIIFCF